MVALSVAAAVAVVGGRAGSGPAQALRPTRARVYLVRSGDTVWGIAQRLAGPTADPRPMVDRLVVANHVENGVVVPGQRLVVSTTG